MINGLNHLTLSASRLEVSIEFYSLLGFNPRVKWRGGAYLDLDEVWLCLTVQAATPAKDYSHIAFSTTLEGLAQCRSLCDQYGWQRWQSNRSEGDSLYILDPDGHKLELHCGDKLSRLAHLVEAPYDGLQWL